MGGNTRIQREISEMRETGRQIFSDVVAGKDFRMHVDVIRRGAEVTKSRNFKYLEAEEIKYSATNPFNGASVSETWMRSVSGGPGVTVLPIMQYRGVECPVLIFKPNPAVASWSLELVAGSMRRNETHEMAALRELNEETGLFASNVRVVRQLGEVWHAPNRLGMIDAVTIAEGITYEGRQGVEREEAPISPFVATWREVETYLDRNAIKSSMSIVVLSTYLRKHPHVLKESRRP